jgi:hypothetical protein
LVEREEVPQARVEAAAHRPLRHRVATAANAISDSLQCKLRAGKP